MILSRTPRQRNCPERQGVSTVEFAVVSAVTLFLILAVVIGGMGMFRYQEVAHLAREGARYASTHGGKYLLDGIAAKTGVPAVSSSSDLRTYLLPKTSLLDPSHLSISVAWSAPSSIVPQNIPSWLDTNPLLVPPGQIVYRNYVTVTVTYQWMPELYLIGPITLKSTSVMPMSY